MRAALLALAAASAAVVALAACQGAHPVTPAREGPRTTTFPHDKHGGFDCADCHTGIPAAKRLGEATLPGPEKCKECHEVDTMSAADKAAHTPPVREARAPYSLTFDHAGHLARIKTKEPSDACRVCHADAQLPQAGETRSSTPRMQACTGCHHHAEDVANARCTPCHVSLRRYRLEPIEALAGLSHDRDFKQRLHGRLAKATAETCAQCHDQTFCARCHANATVPFRTEIRFPERIQADFIHRGDFVSRHQIEASADPASCRKCHGSYFCDSCHTAQNTSPRNALAGGNPRNPHPPGWSFPGSGSFHGTAARQNIVACAGCHDQGAASICATCHRSLGPGAAAVGGNPHPLDFRNKHSRDDIRKNGMCLACHTNG